MIFRKKNKATKKEMGNCKNIYCLKKGHFYKDPPKIVAENFQEYAFYPKDINNYTDFFEITFEIIEHLTACSQLLLHIIDFEDDLPLSFSNADYFCNSDNSSLIIVSTTIDRHILKNAFNSCELLKYKIYAYKNLPQKCHDFSSCINIIESLAHDVSVEVYGEHDYLQIYLKDFESTQALLIGIAHQSCAKYNKILEYEL